MKIKSFEKGMSLVEMLVAIFLLTLGMIGFSLLVSRTWRTKGYIMEAAAATSTASRALTEVAHQLRGIRQGDDGSYPIKNVQPYSITVYRDDDDTPDIERVHYFIDDGKLKKGVTKFTENAYAEADENVEVLLNYVTNQDIGEPLFYYYNNDYPVNTQSHMITPNAHDVRLVRVHLWVNVRPIVAPENVNLETFVEMRNLNEY